MARRVLSDDERVLWSAVTKSIAPLRETAPQQADETPAATAKPPRAASRVPPPPPPVRAEAQKPPHHAPQPLGRRKRSRVARGKDEIDGRLDLHGLTQSEAHATLLRFLRAASARQARLVLVITGKGGKSSDLGGRGVLRRQLPHWLALPEFRSVVVGFEQASICHGGEGAWYVSVRRGRDA